MRDEVFKNKEDNFEFDREIANVFEDMINRSVPFYKETNHIISEYIVSNEIKDSNIYDLGCSTGDLLYLLSKRVNNTIKLIGIDNSLPMIEKAKGKVPDITFLNEDILHSRIINASAVVMNWTLQFINLDKRQDIINNIHYGLFDGGCFILSEKILGETKETNDQLVKQYHEFKKRQGYTESEIVNKKRALDNYLIPLTVRDNINMLKRGGFKKVDVLFKCYNFATFIAIK